MTSPAPRLSPLDAAFVSAAWGLAAATVLGFFGEALWWLDLFAHFRLDYLAASAALAAYLLWRRRTFPGALALAAFAVNAALVLPYFSTVASAGADADRRFKVVALNLQFPSADYDAVGRFLRRESADAVVLVEVAPHWAAFVDTLADLYPHRLVMSKPAWRGIALLAKEPWREARAVYDESLHLPLVEARFGEGERAFTLFGVKLMPPILGERMPMQKRQVEWLVGRLAGVEGPLLLAGDLNATLWSLIFRRLVHGTRLRHGGGGLQPSWPALLFPLSIPIDHVLATPEARVIGRRAGPYVGSDHRPVVAEFGLGS